MQPESNILKNIPDPNSEDSVPNRAFRKLYYFDPQRSIKEDFEFGPVDFLEFRLKENSEFEFATGKPNASLYRMKRSNPQSREFILKKVVFDSESLFVAEQTINREVYYMRNVDSPHCVKSFAIEVQEFFRTQDQNPRVEMRICMELCEGYLCGGQRILTLEDYLNSPRFLSFISERECLTKKTSKQICSALKYGSDIQESMESGEKERVAVGEYRNLEILCQILMALFDLNKRHIIHQDLKPQNVLFMPDKSLRLADFETISIFYDSNIEGIGTMPYIAPQMCEYRQTRQSFDNGFKLDTWALGLIAFNMFEPSDVWPHKLKQILREFKTKGSLSDQISDHSIFEKAKEKSKGECTKCTIISHNLKAASDMICKMIGLKVEDRAGPKEIFEMLNSSGLIPHLCERRKQNFFLSYLPLSEVEKMLTYKGQYTRLSEERSELLRQKNLFEKKYRKYRQIQTNGPLSASSGRTEINTEDLNIYLLYQYLTLEQALMTVSEKEVNQMLYRFYEYERKFLESEKERLHKVHKVVSGSKLELQSAVGQLSEGEMKVLGVMAERMRGRLAC